MVKRTTVYRTIAWKDGRIWTVMAPSVPGVFGTGKTYAAARKDFEDALRTLVGYLTDIGEPLPRSEKLHVGVVRVPRRRAA